MLGNLNGGHCEIATRRNTSNKRVQYVEIYFEDCGKAHRWGGMGERGEKGLWWCSERCNEFLRFTGREALVDWLRNFHPLRKNFD